MGEIAVYLIYALWIAGLIHVATEQPQEQIRHIPQLP